LRLRFWYRKEKRSCYKSRFWNTFCKTLPKPNYKRTCFSSVYIVKSKYFIIKQSNY